MQSSILSISWSIFSNYECISYFTAAKKMHLIQLLILSANTIASLPVGPIHSNNDTSSSGASSHEIIITEDAPKNNALCTSSGYTAGTSNQASIETNSSIAGPSHRLVHSSSDLQNEATSSRTSKNDTGFQHQPMLIVHENNDEIVDEEYNVGMGNLNKETEIRLQGNDLCSYNDKPGPSSRQCTLVSDISKESFKEQSKDPGPKSGPNKRLQAGKLEETFGDNTELKRKSWTFRDAVKFVVDRNREEKKLFMFSDMQEPRRPTLDGRQQQERKAALTLIEYTASSSKSHPTDFYVLQNETKDKDEDIDCREESEVCPEECIIHEIDEMTDNDLLIADQTPGQEGRSGERPVIDPDVAQALTDHTFVSTVVNNDSSSINDFMSLLNWSHDSERTAALISGEETLTLQATDQNQGESSVDPVSDFRTAVNNEGAWIIGRISYSHETTQNTSAPVFNNSQGASLYSSPSSSARFIARAPATLVAIASSAAARLPGIQTPLRQREDRINVSSTSMNQIGLASILDDNQRGQLNTESVNIQPSPNRRRLRRTVSDHSFNISFQPRPQNIDPNNIVGRGRIQARFNPIIPGTRPPASVPPVPIMLPAELLTQIRERWRIQLHPPQNRSQNTQFHSQQTLRPHIPPFRPQQAYRPETLSQQPHGSQISPSQSHQQNISLQVREQGSQHGSLQLQPPQQTRQSGSLQPPQSQEQTRQPGSLQQPQNQEQMRPQETLQLPQPSQQRVLPAAIQPQHQPPLPPPAPPLLRNVGIQTVMSEIGPPPPRIPQNGQQSPLHFIAAQRLRHQFRRHYSSPI